MIPVLAVKDPDAALLHLTQRLALVAEGKDSLRFGDQRIRLCRVDAPPAGMIPMRLDHIALRIADADRQHRQLAERGARLSPGFTPDGPREIAEFWENGVRYVFFDGPEGWPVEFCARIGRPDVSEGHDHLAIRTTDLDAVEAELASLGASRIARHLLGTGDATVEVRFLSVDGTVFELFDEAAPDAAADQPGGWIGFLPE